MTVPFKVKAVYEYKSDEVDDLIFGNGQIITVTEDDDADWYTGNYTTADGQTKEGIFPRNFVEKYEPAVPTRPTRAPRKPAQPDVAESQGPAVSEQAPVPATLPPPIAHEPAKEASIDPPKEFTEPPPTVKADPQVPPPTEQTKPPAKKPPPVVEKPSSFKDRIAAFNKPAAAPVTPFKPPTVGSGSTFIKKPFVAPPPSRNAYVPPPRDLPPPKVYQREEELETERAEPEPQIRPPPVNSEDAEVEDDQPKPTSLKDRIALLQKQQMEQAQRQADPARKKEKPKRPPKARTESSEMLSEPSEEVAQAEQPATRALRDDTIHEPTAPSRVSTDEPAVIQTPPAPARELVSDTNDADDSAGADTEDAQDLSTEEERAPSKPIKSPTVAGRTDTQSEEKEEEGTDTEEEEDPEVRRKRELRERMAKMSGGMGMMGMFGPTPAAAAPRRTKTVKEERAPEHQEPEETARAPPVPIMALPGMSNLKQMPKPVQEAEDDDEAAEPTPVAVQDAEEDYISRKLSRRSTERSMTSSIRERAPPPPPPTDRPEPPQSPGARPAPPPPPPTRTAGELPTVRAIEEPDNEYVMVPSSPPSARPLSMTGPSGPRAMPPPPPNRGLSRDSEDLPTSARPVPMSPTSPTARPPPPPPPGQSLSRRTTGESHSHAPVKDGSEDEVTEYDGDYDTDIATGEKHKAALRSHNRDSSLDEGTFSDDAPASSTSPQTRAVPPIPPIPSAAAPRDVPPPPPPSAAPKARESVDVPRSMPPPLPPQPPRGLPPARESMDFPRAAPPPVPPPQIPQAQEEYDPYRSSIDQGLPGMVAALRKPTDEYSDDEGSPVQQYGYSPVPPAERSLPPPPPTERAAPPTAPMSNALGYGEPDTYSMSGALSANKAPGELGRSNTLNRRSAEVPRTSNEQGFIAADMDLAPNSMWWTRENNPPPVLQNRNDVLWEVESSTTQKRGGKSSVSRDVYVLYQDYSQTTINATFDASEPTHVSFEQSHERPPMQPRKDQLESASETFGAQIARAADKASGSSVGEGSAHEFVAALIRSLHSALMPVGTRAYGALVYANLANASTQQFDEIRPGDIITFRNAKFAGHKGSLHQKYSQDIGTHVGVVIDWDGTKKKIRVWEQGNQERGKKAKIRDESYRVADLKSGEVRVWRVMPRSYVNWGTT